MYKANDPQVASIIDEHLPFGFPTGIGDDSAGEILLAQPHFIIWYDTDLRVPLWSAHHLTRHEAAASSNSGEASGHVAAESRKDSFRSDLRLDRDHRSQCRDYKEPIFDQGHVVPNADVDFITSGMQESLGMDHSFLMSNMTPQHCAFNRGPWMVLERLVRHWATKADETWIVTGTVFDRNGVIGRDSDAAAWRMKGKDGRRVAIPSAQYKIVARREQGRWYVLTVLIPNTDDKIKGNVLNEFLEDHVKSLDEIRQVTGFGFFHGSIVDESGALWPVPNEERWHQQLDRVCKEAYPDK